MPLSAPVQLTLAFAQNGVKNTIPNSSQIAVTPGLASFNDGFPPLTRTAVAAGGVPPFGEDMNGVLYALSLALQWEQAGGSYAYSSAFATAVGGYPLAATVPSSDGLGNWLNTTANNTVDPENAAAPNGWQPVLQRGITSVALTNANVTLTNLQSAKENIVFTGTLTGNVVVTVSPFIKDFKFINGTGGAFTLQVKTPTGGTITLGAGATTLRGDGTTLNGPDSVNVGAATLAGQAVQLGQLTAVGINPGRLLRTSVYYNNAGTLYVSVNGGAFAAAGSSTFATLAATQNVDVECQGAGAGTGGCAATSSTSYCATSGAQSGAYSRGLFTTAQINGALITCGAAGTAAAAGNNNGGAGGSSSVGALISAPGGAATQGTGAFATTNNFAAAPPSTSQAIGSGGYINMPCGSGQLSLGLVTAAGNSLIVGAGGSSPLGQGGIARNSGGNNGQGFGAGASGSGIGVSTSAATGFAGSAGANIFREYA